MRTSERGEGKIGCILTLVVLVALGAVSAKVVPVFYANNSLAETADDLATKAGILTPANIELQMREKAKELEIPEAIAKGAMVVTVIGDKSSGTCNIRLDYNRKVDLFGVYEMTIETRKTIRKPYMDVR